MQAVTVISTSSSGELSAADTVVRAGLLAGKYFAYSSLYAATSSRFVRCVVTVSTLSSEVPAAARIVLIRSSTLRVCSRMSLPTSPVTGCRPVWPDTKTRFPNLVAGDRLGLAAAGLTCTISFLGIASPSRLTLPHFRKYFLGQHVQLVQREALRHARPLHAHDEMVDPGRAVEREHLLGDLVRRADEEPVVDQIVELGAQVVVARWHRAVLAPLVIRPVLRRQERRAEPNRLAPRPGHEHLAPGRELGRERLAAVVERALVHLHLPHDRVDAGVGGDVPAGAEPRGAANRPIGGVADPERRMRLLHGARRGRGAPQSEVRRHPVDRVVGPQLPNGLQILLA